MPDISPASDAGAGAEALLGLAAGRQVRLPSLNTLPDATKNDHAPLHSTPQHHFLPSPPPLQIPSQSPTPASQIPHLPPPSPALHTNPNDRLPTISEWSDPAFRTLPPPPLHPLPSSEQHSERWKSPASLPTPFAYSHPHAHWSHARSNPYPQHLSQPFYYYDHSQTQPHSLTHQQPQPQPLSAYNLPSRPIHSALPPPLALAVRRSDTNNSSKSLPPVTTIPSIPVLNHHLCSPTGPESQSTSNPVLPSLGVAIPADSGLLRSPLIPVPLLNSQVTNERLPSVLSTPAERSKPSSRGRGIADLINPIDSPPSSSNNISLLQPEAMVSKPLVEAPKVETQLMNETSSMKSDVTPTTNYLPLSPNDRSLNNPLKNQVSPQDARNRELGKDEACEVTCSPSSPVKRLDGTSMSPRPDRKAQTPSTSGDRQGDKRKESGSELTRSNSRKEENGDSDEIRCPCKKAVNAGTMLGCDGCNKWQHFRCMGFRRRTEVPEEYYCERCRPEEMRLGCVAHPRYKDRNSKDREGKDSKLDPVLSNVKPVELRKLFAADMKHKKNIAKGGVDCIITKYANLWRTQFPKYRNGVVEGLVLLLDSSRAEISERLDFALRKFKLRQESAFEKLESQGERKKSEPQLSEEMPTENHQRSIGNSRSSAKRQRPQSLAIDQLDVNSVKVDNLSPSVELPGDVDMNDCAGNRGMSREERKLQAEMRLFKRMEERERERKRPRNGEVGQSPRAGHPPRPKTPRGSSNPRITSPKLNVYGPREMDEQKMRPLTERHSQQFEDLRKPEHVDGSGSHSTKVNDKEDRAESPEKLAKVENCKHTARALTQTSRAEVEPTREPPRRERHRVDRQLSRRRESSESTNLHRQKLGSILERNRSHDLKRRRALRDGRYGKDFKRDPILDVVVHVPGPSVLGSKLVPNTRVSSLGCAERCEDNEKAVKVDAGRKFPLPKKDASTRKKHMAWQNLVGDACPTRKRHRFPFFEVRQEEHEQLEKKAGSRSKCEGEKNLSVSMVVVSEKELLPDKGKKLETSLLVCTPTRSNGNDKEREGEWKGFSLKKRLIESEAARERKIEKDIGKISPVSPNGAVSPTAGRGGKSCVKEEVRYPRTATPTPTSPIVYSPISTKLRSTSISSPLKPLLRSAPVLAAAKRGRSPSYPTTSVGDAGKGVGGSAPLLPENGSMFLKSRLSRDAASEAACSSMDKSSSDSVRRLFSIPLSKPVPVAVNRCASEGSTPTAGGVKRSGGVSLRSIRPSALTSVPNPRRRWNGAGSDGKDVAVDVAMKSQDALDMNGSSDGCTISDILQQRLEGLMKEPGSAAGAASAGDALKKSDGGGVKDSSGGWHGVSGGVDKRRVYGQHGGGGGTRGKSGAWGSGAAVGAVGHNRRGYGAGYHSGAVGRGGAKGKEEEDRRRRG